MAVEHIMQIMLLLVQALKMIERCASRVTVFHESGNNPAYA